MRVLSLLSLPRRMFAGSALPAALVAAAVNVAQAQTGAGTAVPPPATAPAGETPPRIDPPDGAAQSPTAAPAVPPTPIRLTEAEERQLRRRLADLLVERAIEIVAVEGGPASNLDLGLEILQRVVEIDPDDADHWRVLLQLADLAEQPAAARMALERLGKLDPADDGVTLRRLETAIDSLDTAEQRATAYEKLLGGKVVGQFSPAVASRLALGYAGLLQRTGDIDGFAKWLAESVALDPANPAAVSSMTEFFASATDDAAALAELMVARCLADPANLPAIEQLGALLLARGAPVGARRVLQLAVDTGGGARDVSPTMLTLLVLATWLADDADGALRLIDLRQRAEDGDFRAHLETLRLTIESGDTSDEGLERAVEGLSAPAVAAAQRLLNGGPLTNDRVQTAISPIWPDLAAARAAITQARGDNDAAAAARALVEIEQTDSDLARADAGDPAPRSAAMTNAAWWMLFLGDDVPAAKRSLQQAAAIAPVDPAMRTLIDGWVAMREARLDDAVAEFTTCAGSDPRCDLGLGVVLLRRGDRKLGAGRLLAAARAMPGTVAGAWALETLYKELGVRVPAWPGAAEVESMAATLPTTFDRLLLEPQRELSIAARPITTVRNPLDRIELTVDVANRSAMPLALGPDGPLRTTVAIPLVMTTYGVESGTGALPLPGLVDIGQRLGLGSRSDMSIRANLSRCIVSPGQTLGTLVRNFALMGSGANLTGRALLNPVPVMGAGAENRLVVGILGVESAPMDFRVESKPFDAGWRTAAVAAVEAVDRVEDLDLLATLAVRASQADLAGLTRLQPDQRAAVETALREQVSALEKALPQLPPLAQAWLAMHLVPDQPQISALAAALRASPDPVVRLASLVSLTSGNQDPLLDATRRGDDPALSRIAELLTKTLRRAITTPEPASGAGP